ncbi:MAG: hypothetical protein BAA01_04155 [Bacillus thermozeamaize]|uniref:Uncharacterized protein n=1 Tax=Bacillus thermozeamaize TaxID=230954 RepID=A0A1Y3PCX9_9BACI|nr:MAG: hypothetical protein BAA01_04155 [Bacillus thermozeamaize]
MRLRNVCTMEEANRVLPELIDKHNRLFAVAPQEAEPAYRPLPEVPLEHIFARRVHRRISGGQTFSWQGKCYMPQPGSGVPRWEARQLSKCASACKVKYGCGIRGVHGHAWKCHKFKSQKRRWPKKQRHLRLHASPLQTTPGENHSPASNTSVAQPAGIRQDHRVDDATVFLTGLSLSPETATRTSRAAKPSSSDDCRFTATLDGRGGVSDNLASDGQALYLTFS